jgi:hypothetical protein
MNGQTFEKPISVLIGLGFIRTVPNVMAAYELVAEWPASPRSSMQIGALRACRAALNGQCTAEDARTAFLCFADHAGILMEDPAPLIAGEAKAQTRGVLGMN